MSVTTPAVDVRRLQSRTIRTLAGTQILGGVGLSIGVSVGSLLFLQLTGTPGMSGLGQSLSVIGGAVIAIPVVRVTNAFGRRPGLVLSYALGTVGAAIIILAVIANSVVLGFLGMFLFGGGTAGNLQSRYTAADLAEPARRGRQLSFVVWATTIGAVGGPLVMPQTDQFAQDVLGLPKYAGPFLASGAGFILAGLVLWLMLRPDPLLTARALAETPETTGADRGLAAGWRAVRTSPGAVLGLAAVAIGHIVMVGMMVMTPVHIKQNMDAHTGHGMTVEGIVGLVLAMHVAGMYALSPIVGWAADKFGRKPVILAGVGFLLASAATAGTAGDGTWQLGAGLMLLGLGWSCTMVGGSALLTESVDVVRRASAQALSDVTMGVAGASAGALSGVIMDGLGYPILALCAAVATVPVVALALRARK